MSIPAFSRPRENPGQELSPPVGAPWNNINGILLAMKFEMISKSTRGKFWSTMPPWLLLGAIAVLLPIFAFTTWENINRQKQHGERILLERGAQLIRSFEAGTYTGVMHWDSFKLQQLLIETAQQRSDIHYLMVTNLDGRIVANSDPEQNGQFHGRDLDLADIAHMDQSNVKGHVVRQEGQPPVFEVYSRFSPTTLPMSRGSAARAFQDRFEKLMEEFGFPTSENLIIFVGLDMSTIEATRRAYMRHAILMGTVLLFIGFGGFVLLMLFQSNRATRISLSRIKAFSDNLVENMPIGLVALDPDRVIATVNQVAASMLDIHEADATGEPAASVLPAQIYELVERLNQEPEIIDCQIDCRLPDGRSLPVEATATPLKDETNQFFGYALLLKDLREIQALRKEVARTQRLATVGRLAAGVAHEIRNPLSSIKGFATYFKERYPDIHEDQQIAGIMIQEVDKLNRVVGQLLEFARPVAIVQKWVELSPLIEDSLKLVEQQARNRNIQIKRTISPQSLQGWIDPDRINQVLLNLYLNGMEAMEKDGVLNVETTTTPDLNTLIIRVSDTGPGVDAEDITHIFDPYYTTKPSGTGLGLAIVHNIIEAHHGHIIPEKRPEGGVSMTVYLPIPDTRRENDRSNET